MAEFPNLPDDIYQYQNQFNYSVWTPDTVVTCCNVPWDSSYRDIVRFDSDQAREEYFSSLAGYSFRVNGMVYLRYNDPIRVNIPFHEVNSCNYIIVKINCSLYRMQRNQILFIILLKMCNTSRPILRSLMFNLIYGRHTIIVFRSIIVM